MQRPDRQLHLLMANLLYPAVHGTLLYTLLQVIVEKPAPAAPPDEVARRSLQAVFLACLVVHFAVDYLYTIINEHEPDYRLPSFLFDFVVVACLFLAGSAVPVKAGDSTLLVWGGWANPATWLALGKFASALWEWRLRRDPAVKARSRYGLASDLYFCGLYAFLAAQYSTLGLGPVFAVLMLDTAGYFAHRVFHPAAPGARDAGVMKDPAMTPGNPTRALAP